MTSTVLGYNDNFRTKSKHFKIQDEDGHHVGECVNVLRIIKIIMVTMAVIFERIIFLAEKLSW